MAKAAQIANSGAGKPCGGGFIPADKQCRVEMAKKAVETEGKAYKRETVWGSKQFGGPFKTPVRGKRLGRLKLEGGKLKWPSPYKGEKGIMLSEDDVKNYAATIHEARAVGETPYVNNGGQGSGCHGPNCGRKKTSVDALLAKYPIRNTEDGWMATGDVIHTEASQTQGGREDPWGRPMPPMKASRDEEGDIMFWEGQTTVVGVPVKLKVFND